MNDTQRYRMNAAECILAGERCGPAYRDLTFALAKSWLSLARQQEAMDEVLVIWSNASSATSTVSSPHCFMNVGVGGRQWIDQHCVPDPLAQR
jgi:hypothetical protein